METQRKFDVAREARELRNQLSVSKRIGFFFGAGTSMSLGIPGIIKLTQEIENKLEPDEKKILKKIKSTLGADVDTPTIEDILNQTRLIRQITKESESLNFVGIDGVAAKKIDNKICKLIYDIISEKEHLVDLAPTEKFFSWLNWLSRDYSKEVFTTNYDLIFEKALEKLQIPYFDGFVGANEPFFLPESLEPANRLVYPPLSWTRILKIHGSLGWFWRRKPGSNSFKVVRMGVLAKPSEDMGELVIYPSKEKYESSRKQPFIAYFDRLRSYLLEQEGLFIINGYSFSDEHINGIIFNGLKQNNRLHIIFFPFDDNCVDQLIKFGSSYPNFTVYGRKKAIIGGMSGEWNIGVDKEASESFWDSSKDEFILGDFKLLVDFFIESSGKKEKIEEEIRAKS